MKGFRSVGAVLAAALALSACLAADDPPAAVSPVTSVEIVVDGWQDLEGAATGYWNAILAAELTAGEGAGSRIVIQEGIPSTMTAREHRDRRVLELEGRGIEAVAIGERMIDAAPAAGLRYRQVNRTSETWYTVKGGLRYVIHLESEEGAREMSPRARDVLAHLEIRR